MRNRYCVVRYRKTRVIGGAIFKFDGVIAGMGKNRNTWDSDHSRSAAYAHAAKLRAECDSTDFRFRVETTT